ncbi:MAG: hypothetical protein ABIR54_13340 [Burkholderiaceae bacterium]
MPVRIEPISSFIAAPGGCCSKGATTIVTRGEIKRAAVDVGATFEALTPCHYGDHYQRLLLERELDDRPLVIVDPDVIFWEDIEGWEFGDALMAGRLIPEFREASFVSRPRLHPSLFWVPNVARLRAEVARKQEAFPAWDCIGPSPRQYGCTEEILLDTLAPLYEAFQAQCVAFDEQHLDCYDHIFHGSHWPINAGCEHPGFERFTADHLLAAAGQLAPLRGIWRAQQEYFDSDHACPRLERERMELALTMAKGLQSAQGLCSEGGELAQSLQLLMMRMAMMPRQQKPIQIGKDSGLAQSTFG